VQLLPPFRPGEGILLYGFFPSCAPRAQFKAQ
jgi:hypothetical protein